LKFIQYQADREKNYKKVRPKYCIPQVPEHTDDHWSTGESDLKILCTPQCIIISKPNQFELGSTTLLMLPLANDVRLPALLGSQRGTYVYAKK